MIAEWRYRRAVYRGLLKVHPEIEHEIREHASQHRTSGRPWMIEGFDSVQPTDICAQLAEMGVEVSEEAFLKRAEDVPGPKEIALEWLGFVAEKDGYTPFQLELAARALWRKWAVEMPSVESAADEIEEGLLKVAGGQGSPEIALRTIERFGEFSEGYYRLAEAISDELPMRIWPWILDQYRAERTGERSVDEWLKAGEELIPVFPSRPILHAVLSRFAAANGAAETAKSHGEQAMETGGADVSYVLVEVALAFASLGEDGLATTFSERALVTSEDEQDEQAAEQAIRLVCDRLGCASEAEGRVHRAKKSRMEMNLAKRRSRRRKDKKGKGKRR